MMERHYFEEEAENAKYKKRLIWLIPFNVLAVVSTVRYCRNINTIGKKIILSHLKPLIRIRHFTSIL
jgi:hypothetical protein